MYLRSNFKLSRAVRFKNRWRQCQATDDWEIDKYTLPIRLLLFERNSFVFYILWFYFDFIVMDYL